MPDYPHPTGPAIANPLLSFPINPTPSTAITITGGKEVDKLLLMSLHYLSPWLGLLLTPLPLN